MEIDLPDRTVVQNIIDAAQKYPSNSALFFGNVVEPLRSTLLDSKMDHRTLFNLPSRFAGVLQQPTVKKGNRVAIHLPNCPQLVICYYAALMVGGIAVPCNPSMCPVNRRTNWMTQAPAHSSRTV